MSQQYDFFVVDEPRENDTQAASANIYYSTPSTSNRIIITRISSQTTGLMNYLDVSEYDSQSLLQEQFEDDLSLELEAWDTLSDEALTNFEAMLE